MARRLCRLSRLFPLVPFAAASAAPRPHHLPFAVNPTPAPHRLFSSASGCSILIVGSAASFNTILSKVRDEKLRAVFYYTSASCGPCTAITPLVSKPCSQYPEILPVYKVDIDMLQEGLGKKIRDLNIYSVPTFRFYDKGQKIGDLVGVDAKEFESQIESLYKQP